MKQLLQLSVCVAAMLVVMLAWGMPDGEQIEPIGAGFTAGTTVSIKLDYTSVNRNMWISLVGAIMPSTISVSQAGPNQENAIHLRGRRIGALHPDESAWSMKNKIINFGPNQLSARYNFPFGNACLPPPDSTEWSQYYRYVAIIIAGTTVKRGHDTLEVINTMFANSLIEETE